MPFWLTSLKGETVTRETPVATPDADFRLRLPERARIWLGLVTNVLSLGFVVLMVWRLWLQAAFITDKGDTTPILNFPLWPIAYLIAVGSVFLITGLVLHVVDSADRAAHPEKSAPEATERPFQD